MMSNRPPDPKNARNKNVLVVGGSGSGKTRYFIKPNLLQCTSKSHPVSFVVTDPKGGLIQECGLALLKNGYKIRTMNTINFHKSMHYNPFAYIHEEKDILKLVTTLMTNTKGEGQGGDPFWDKAERLLLTSLIAYLHYEAPAEEQNFATLLEMLNTMQVSEEDEDYQNPVDLLFEDLAKKKPNSFAGRQYKLYKLAAGKTAKSILISCDAVITYANRYAKMAEEMAEKETDAARRQELLTIARVCKNVPEFPAESFQEACQSFWFIQQVLQIESSGHSISPGRFDQYMYPYYEKDLKEGSLTREYAQELIDCIWVKLNDLNKCRDAASAEGFAGYSLFQNLIVGGQTVQGRDATNDLSFMCITASEHVFLPMPSLSIRVWHGSSKALLMRAAELTRTGIGLPAYYNDEVIIPALVHRGATMDEARNYNIIGCVEPQVPGKTDGWHDAAFFNMCRPLEMVFSNGYDNGEIASIQTGNVESFQSFDEFMEAYRKQMLYNIELMVNADNAIDYAHAKLAPLPFESCLVDDCIKRGMSAQEGGAIYNFTGPQGFGIANVADSLYTIKKLVFEEKRITMGELKKALEMNYGKGLDATTAGDIAMQVAKGLKDAGQEVGPDVIANTIRQVLEMELPEDVRKRYEEIHEMILELPKYGNDIDEVDELAREAAYFYTRPLETFKNPRGGMYQAGLYPVSANVPLGAQTGATPDGRLAHTPVADGVGPTSGFDISGPTASCNSVAKLDHAIASNGTLFNMKMHPTAMAGEKGLESFISLIRGYFDQQGMHMQFNVVDRATLLDAQAHPEKYSGLIVRVAGYSALFTTLSKSLQDDIIKRTEQADNR